MATTWYCNADSGNDTTGNGTSGTPYLTISKCQTVGADGDTIICQAATAAYDLPTALTKSLTITGASAATVTIQLSNSSNTTVAAAKTVTINTATVSWRGNAFRFAVTGATLNIINCILTGTPQSTWGMFWHNNPVAVSLLIQGCLIKNIAFPASTDGIFMCPSANGGTATVNIYNNTFYFSGAYAGRIFASSNEGNSGIVYAWKNNIIYKGTAGGTNAVYFDTPNSITITATYNCAYGLADSIPSGTGNITGDPLFVDAVNSNFSLKPLSPCRDTGVLL